MGFNLTDLDVMIRKGYIQFNAGYVETNSTDIGHCQAFERAMRAGPISHMNDIKDKFQGISNIA